MEIEGKEKEVNMRGKENVETMQGRMKGVDINDDKEEGWRQFYEKKK